LNKTASAANFAALALLGVVLAYWTWVWLAPAAAARAPAAPESAASSVSSAGLFGSASAGAAASGSIRLIGVVAAWGDRRGHAVLRLDGKTTVAVLQGADIEPGVRLAEVHVDHIVIERSGAREVLAWPEKNK
jgi:general secretion pathway protein C